MITRAPDAPARSRNPIRPFPEDVDSGPSSVVDDRRTIFVDRDPAVGRTAVSNDVGDALTDRPCKEFPKTRGNHVRYCSAPRPRYQPHAMPLALGLSRREEKSPRNPSTAERTSASASRESLSRSSSSLRARSISTSSRRLASSALIVMTVSECPRMSCRSRAHPRSLLHDCPLLPALRVHGVWRSCG